ncbi:MAG: ribosome rescue GTPase HflX [Pseudomonadota bacterium]
MFERYQGGSRAVLVHVNFPLSSPSDLEEFHELAISAGADVLQIVTGQRYKPDTRSFVGVGKLEELKIEVEQHKADLVIFNHELSPAQERNIEREVKCRVIDRTGLILDIFAQRAQSFEGKLQVELAQLRHISSRLVRGWTHLERQKGGIGLRGPGETQLETDRRLIRGRISQILKRLEKVEKQREQGRRSRKRAEVATVSLVGYTNAGKSTLFNRLAQSDVYAEDQLFATLDPTLRQVRTQKGDKFILADTVGFIKHLPHDLVAAFRSTLAETREAQLLLHVIDSSSEEMEDQRDEVYNVLESIGAQDVHCIEVCNKIDALENLEPRIDYDDEGQITRVWVSAKTGAGMELLLNALGQRIFTNICEKSIVLSVNAAQVRSRLYRDDYVQEESIAEDGSFWLRVRMKNSEWQRLLNEFPKELDKYVNKC